MPRRAAFRDHNRPGIARLVVAAEQRRRSYGSERRRRLLGSSTSPFFLVEWISLLRRSSGECLGRDPQRNENTGSSLSGRVMWEPLATSAPGGPQAAISIGSELCPRNLQRHARLDVLLFEGLPLNRPGATIRSVLSLVACFIVAEKSGLGPHLHAPRAQPEARLAVRPSPGGPGGATRATHRTKLARATRGRYYSRRARAGSASTHLPPPYPNAMSSALGAWHARACDRTTLDTLRAGAAPRSHARPTCSTACGSEVGIVCQSRSSRGGAARPDTRALEFLTRPPQVAGCFPHPTHSRRAPGECFALVACPA